MRAFVIFALIAVALARPDVSHLKSTGYTYDSPSGSGTGVSSSVSSGSGTGRSFGGSSGGFGGSSGGSFGGSSGGFGGSSGGSFGGSSGGSTGGGFGGSSGGSFGGSSSGRSFDAPSGGNFGGSSGGSFGGSSGGSFGGSSSGGFGGSSGGSFGGSSGGAGPNVIDGGVHQGQTQVIDISGGSSSSSNVVYKPVVKQGAPQIIKSFYIHEAPEEAPINVEVKEKEINVRPQKHYKIIFIKAPSAGGAGAFGGNAAIFPQNEEKTIVYVLSKKADGGISENGEFPTPPPAVTSKPEVFFVKYKTDGEAAGAISSIQESFKEGGAGFENPAQFAQTIGASSGSASASSFSQEGSSSGSFGGSSSGSFGGASSGSTGGSFGGSSSGGSFGGSAGGSFGGSSGGARSFDAGSFGGDSNTGSVGSSGSGFSANENTVQTNEEIQYLPPSK